MLFRARSGLARRAAALMVLGYGLVLSASAQEHRIPSEEGSSLFDTARVYPQRDAGLGLPAVPSKVFRVIGGRSCTNNIMLTGYWPPTNEMLRPFSPNPDQNPGGWVGADWEGRGYNVYAFFPEFPQGLGKGVGDFEVDYQDTSNDFWVVVEQLDPVAIITTGRAEYDMDWELEGGNRMLELDDWMDDYLEPFQPTPDLPIAGENPGETRWATLPFPAIIAAVESALPAVNAYYTLWDGSDFLCAFIGYHANWYHEMHAGPDDPVWNVAAGHIHVGYQISDQDAAIATEVTLRTLIDYLDEQIVILGDMDCDHDVDFDDINPFVLALSGEAAYYAEYPDCHWLNADCDEDGDVDFDDINPFVAQLGG